MRIWQWIAGRRFPNPTTVLLSVRVSLHGPPSPGIGMAVDRHLISQVEKGITRRTLATKLRPPSKGVRHLPRPRFTVDLASVDPFRLVLISAPAGSGKTTFLSEWYLALQKRYVAAAWPSLDDFDNEPRRFLSHLISAVQAVRPDFGREALQVLTVNPDVLISDVAVSLIHNFGRTTSP